MIETWIISKISQSVKRQKVLSSAIRGTNRIPWNAFLVLGFVKISGYSDSFKRRQVTETTLSVSLGSILGTKNIAVILAGD